MLNHLVFEVIIAISPTYPTIIAAIVNLKAVGCSTLNLLILPIASSSYSLSAIYLYLYDSSKAADFLNYLFSKC